MFSVDIDNRFSLDDDGSRDWFEMMGDNSNCSMASADFSQLPLADLERSLDSRLDVSNQGIPGMIKQMKVGSQPSELSTDRGIFNPTDSHSRKRRHDFDPNAHPPKKTKTEDFSEFITSIQTATVPDDVGDPFLIHDDTSIDGLPKNRNKKPPLSLNNSSLDLKPSSFEDISPFNTPFQFERKKTWAQIAGCEKKAEEESEQKVTTAASSDSGSSPQSNPSPFPWNLSSLKKQPDKSDEMEADTTEQTEQEKQEQEALKQKRIKKRLEQIRLGKETQGYKNYLKRVPREKRRFGRNGDVFTPDWTDLTISKRRFFGMVREWRKRLHDYDQLADDIKTDSIKIDEEEL